MTQNLILRRFILTNRFRPWKRFALMALVGRQWRVVDHRAWPWTFRKVPTRTSGLKRTLAGKSKLKRRRCDFSLKMPVNYHLHRKSQGTLFF